MNLEDVPHLTDYNCYGKNRTLTVSWSRINDWMKCKQRVKLIFQGKKSKLTNARNFLAGNVADNTMRFALENASKDPQGRLLSLTMDDLLAPLPDVWEKSITKLQKGTVMTWKTADPREDQKALLTKAKTALEKLHPILEDNLFVRRYIPEMRPSEMPIIGIPGPDGEDCFIRLFLAVDMAVQLEEGETPTSLGEWGLYDLKTTESEEYLNKTLPQLAFYDIAWENLTGKRPVDWALWAPLAKEPIRQANVTEEARMKVLNWITSYCHSVWRSEEDLASDDKECYNCPTKNACPKNLNPWSKADQGLSMSFFGDNENKLTKD